MGKTTQEFMILYNREHKYNQTTINSTVARGTAFSQGIGHYTRLISLGPFRSIVAFKSSTLFQDRILHLNTTQAASTQRGLLFYGSEY